MAPDKDDLTDAARLADIIAGTDAFVSAFGPSSNDPRYTSDQDYTDQLVSVAGAIAAVKKAGVLGCSLLWAGSLVFTCVTVLDSGYWPDPMLRLQNHTLRLCSSSVIRY